MPEATEPQLTEAQVDEYEKRRYAAVRSYHSGDDVNWFLTVAIPALIRDWRAMKAENELAEKVLKFILPNRPLATITEIAKPALDEVDALREQLAAMKIERDNFERMALALSAQLESELRG